MSNEEILEKAIKKAINNGWLDMEIPLTRVTFPEDEEGLAILIDFDRNTERANFYGFASYYDVIFDHDFAKALWGENGKYWHNPMDLDRWKWHLQQMVIADDPFIYLKENM